MSSFDQFVAPNYPVFLGSEITQPEPEAAFFHVLPIPYEASVSYGEGTASGPRAILEASWQLETFDGRSYPTELGIYTHAPVDCAGEPAEVIEHIANAVHRIAKAGKFPVGLGGEHSVTLGIIRGLLATGVEDFGIVQIDAHADLREAYEDNPYSHASVMKRLLDEGLPLLQLGIRALCKEEVETRQQFKVHHIDAEKLVMQNIMDIDFPDDFPDRIFFTLDIDGMDPSIFPSTGTPVPGGLGWYQTLKLFESAVSQKQIVGFDITEFAPIENFHCYEFSAAQLAYKMMGIVQRHQ